MHAISLTHFFPQGDAWGSASAGGLSASGLGPAGATDFASAVAPSFDGSLSGALGGGEGAFGSDQAAHLTHSYCLTTCFGRLLQCQAISQLLSQLVELRWELRWDQQWDQHQTC